MSDREAMAGDRDCGGDVAAYLLGALDPNEAEGFRLHLEQLSPQWSIVINPRRKAFDAPVSELHREIQRLFLRCSGS